MRSVTLASLLEPAGLAELAGMRSYARGAAYHDDGRVEVGVVRDERVEALVRGTMPYEVALWAEGGRLGWSCSCPVGEDGSFCKHCVAVGLMVGSQTPPPGRSGRKSTRNKAKRPVDLRAYVERLELSELVDLVMEQADADWRLRERLVARAMAESGSGIDERAWRRRLDAVFGPEGGYVDYREAATWAGDVGDVIEALAEQAEAGHAAAVTALAEHAHRLADASVGYVDDSDGYLADISARIGAVHLRACELARPDPIGLAGRLADLELTSELDGFHRAALPYAAVLGERGLAEYQRLIEPKWRALAKKKGTASHEGFGVREAMVGVALATRDPDLLVRVKQHDLHTPSDYQEIAEALLAAGREDEAFSWAQRGLEVHADRAWQTPPLRDFVAGMLHRRGDPAAAVELYREDFDRHPSLTAYRRLVAEAERAGAPGAPGEALGALRKRVAKAPPSGTGPRPIDDTGPATALTEILLYNGDADEAWRVASRHGCPDRLWLSLARAREAEHPLDAIAVYEWEALAQIDTKKNGGYRTAVDLLSRIRRLAEAAGEPGRFEELLAQVRATHKPKRNLMALIAEKGW